MGLKEDDPVNRRTGRAVGLLVVDGEDNAHHLPQAESMIIIMSCVLNFAAVSMRCKSV